MASGVTVLYFMGWTRSGTTILGNVLNEIDGFVHVGELHFLWLNGVLGTGTNRMCGCGDELTRCSLWSAVLDAGRSGGGSLEDHARRVHELQQRRFRTRHTWRLLRGAGDAATAAYVELMTATYRAIGDTTGARVIVDTSKYASEAAVLARAGVRPALVHMVRDPRAVAHSWARAKAYIPSRGTLDSTLLWDGFNLAAEAVRKRHPDATVTIRYEDFVAAPRATVDRLLELVGEPASSNPMLDDRTVRLGPNHTVTGNPDRFETGVVELRPDERWRSGMPRPRRVAATVAAAPWLRRYGYT
ncbi:MAG TPA: sulfotransferase [Actinomycetota bacterium]|nr:sulfotransferase [Actinomycetota bacterium]